MRKILIIAAIVLAAVAFVMASGVVGAAAYQGFHIESLHIW